jgi:hypothetical protein
MTNTLQLGDLLALGRRSSADLGVWLERARPQLGRAHAQ